MPDDGHIQISARERLAALEAIVERVDSAVGTLTEKVDCLTGNMHQHRGAEAVRP